MLGFKRQAFDGCPERSQLKVSKDDASSIYESTLRKMFLGERMDRCSRSTSTASESSSAVVATSEGGHVCRVAASATCDGEATVSAKELAVRRTESGCERALSISTEKSCCLMGNDNHTCFHCRRKVCLLCLKRCATCQQDFCTTCALTDFTERHDRAFCLDCHDSIHKEVQTL